MATSELSAQDLAKLIILNNAVDHLLDASPTKRSPTDTPLELLIDSLLWLEKKQPDLLPSISETGVFQSLFHRPDIDKPTLLRGLTMLYGNCREEGPLLGVVLGLGMRALCCFMEGMKSGEDEQQMQLLASFIKAYHRHWSQTWSVCFVEGGRCLLLEMCCRFYNCPEEIAKTCMMNVLMNLLQLPHVARLLEEHKYMSESVREWGHNMCRLFRNELNSLDKQLLICGPEEHIHIINVINDKVALWEDLSQINIGLFRSEFEMEVLQPLLIGALNIQGIPLFTLKFALFILNKLVMVLFNLRLLCTLGRILFVNGKLHYEQDHLNTALLAHFSLQIKPELYSSFQSIPSQVSDSATSEASETSRSINTINKIEYHEVGSQSQIVLTSEDSPQYFEGVNTYFLSVLKSKDSRFLQLSGNLLFRILNQVRKDEYMLMEFIETTGLGLNGPTVITLSQILINQLCFTHSLHTIKIICSLLKYIQPTKTLSDDACNYFMHVYSTITREALQHMDKNKQLTGFMLETFEYDYKQVQKYSFAPGLLSDEQLLFSPEYIDNEGKCFYEQVPENGDHLMRYIVVKHLIVARLSQLFIESPNLKADKPRSSSVIQHPSDPQKVKSQSNLENSQVPDYQPTADSRVFMKPGMIITLPTERLAIHCKIIEGDAIPSILIDDDLFMIFGYMQGKEVKIILSVKLKHVDVRVFSRKQKGDKAEYQIRVNTFDHQIQGMTLVSVLRVRSQENLMAFLTTKKARLREREFDLVCELLRSRVRSIPETSLI